MTAGVCIIHLIRGSFRYTSKRDWPELATSLKPIYAAMNASAGAAAMDAVEEEWGKPYPAISRLWRSWWELFTSSWTTELVAESRERAVSRRDR